MKTDFINSAESIRPSIVDGALNANGLTLFHVTNFKPTRDDDENIILPSSYIATKGRDKSRHTVHFTLNHHVLEHADASWNEAPYVVIAPFLSVVEKNGPPAMILPADTFFTTNAHDALTLPQAVLVSPAEGDMDELYRADGNDVFYKTKNFTDDQISLISDALPGLSEKIVKHDGHEKEKLLRGAAKAYAAHAHTATLGFEINPANAEGGYWDRKDYSWESAKKLADRLGTKSGVPHISTPYKEL